MPIYTGKSRDGPDMKKVEGFYVSPNGKYWSSKPISLEEEKEMEKQLKLKFSKQLYKPKPK